MTIDLTPPWTLATLPEEARAHLLQQYVLRNPVAYRQSLHARSGDLGLTLFATEEPVIAEWVETPVVWATDNYEERGEGYKPHDAITDLSIIRPRVEKAREEQRRRVKQKAEVFTPSWVCNLQNNLVDEAVLGKHAFNIMSDDQRSWTSTEQVVFPETYSWAQYVASRRLEMCCGEGPYLFSPYDTTTGEHLPVRDAGGQWRRVGILDRKLRVLTEQLSSPEEWWSAALLAVRSTYGFEWQGDNLLLARLNMINTVLEYAQDHAQHYGHPLPSKNTLAKRTTQLAEEVSWQLWQMDSLRMVLPESCSKKCSACKRKQRQGHDGVLSVIRWGSSTCSFESLLDAGREN